MIDPMPTTDMTADVLLRVRDLSVEFPSKRLLKAVDGVSLDVWPGEILGLVGETGSGKTVFVTSILGLIRKPGRITHGSITWRGRDLLDLKERELRSIRGTEISMVFQNPLPSLNPSKRIGAQVRDLLIYHSICPKQQAEDLIADEPTTSLDVTVQAQIIRLILRLKREFGMAVLFVSHDLGVMASICDRVAVMYQGRIVETARSVDLFSKGNLYEPFKGGFLIGRNRSVCHDLLLPKLTS
jgi:ABC-type dipeptide/oligopeptide/nickel transport system ATPase component